MFTRILIANRGEIACRVAATARRMGIASVAVYSDADVHAKHVAVCDTAVRLGPAPARESYLQGERIIAAALAKGAQAIHPGYGFLSENAAFAEACTAAGLVFIGPPAAAIRAMGSKSAAKTLMEAAGVPLVPGYHGVEQDTDRLEGEAGRIGYPVLIKASAGGGGKGMRIVREATEFAAALASCQRESQASFGDATVLVEKYLLRPRHIEIQIFADSHGNCIYLFERDCSVQRRHQKVLEEAPAPGLDPARRSAIGEAAVAAARAVGYIGAGTVEFIADAQGAFYFMEMNTRLQVEHPVTEMITGFDLVEWQLQVAAAERLPRLQSELTIRGHALEARLYAENPERDFLPSTGVLERLRFPPALEFAVQEKGTQDPAAVRVDSGVREGDRITPYYDPMIAKLIVWGSDRTEALARMQRALGETQIVGLASNVAFLSRLVGSEAFQTADLDTGLIERQHALLFAPSPPLDASWLALAVAAIVREEAATSTADPWSQRTGWRLNASLRRTFHFTSAGQRLIATLDYATRGMRFEVHADGAVALASAGGETLELDSSRDRADVVAVVLNGQPLHAGLYRTQSLLHLFRDQRHVVLDWEEGQSPRFEAEVEVGKLTAPMPGKIVAVLVEAGAIVEKGAPLVVMEAMKMEHTITAPAAGQIAQVHYQVGDQVDEGTPLLRFATPAGGA